MTQPAVSVLMSMYNSAAYVQAAVESVLAQSFSDFEFLIVDDGSSDNSAAIVAKLAKSDARITLFRQENRGIVPSVNFLIDQAQAPLIARMDSDDICLPDRFAAQVAHMAAHPELGALGTQFIEIDEQDKIRDAYFRHPTSASDIRAALAERQPIGNPTVMLRTEVIRQIGGYRPAFRYCEDYDLFLRLSRVADIENLPDVHLLYRRSENQMSTLNNHRQTRQAVKALFAHREVLAGGRDPFDGLQDMPELEDMDRVFGRAGVMAAMRAELAVQLRYSRTALAGDEFQYLYDHAASGAPFPGGWRTVARLVKYGMPGRAAQLAQALTAGLFL